MAILRDMSKPTTEELLLAKIAELEAKGKELEARLNGKALAFKVTEKGAISVYGLQRFPVTLYAGQWERLSAEMERIGEFIKANGDKVARKEG
jgi:hypothetical protein